MCRSRMWMQSGDWIHLASLAELIKGIKQRNIDDLPFYLRGLIRMVPLKHMHQILLYAALTDLKTNIQIGVDSSAYIWVRAVQFHGITHTHHDKDGKIPFLSIRMAHFIKISQLSLPCSVMLKWSRRLRSKTQQYILRNLWKISSFHWIDIPMRILAHRTSVLSMTKFSVCE